MLRWAADGRNTAVEIWLNLLCWCGSQLTDTTPHSSAALNVCLHIFESPSSSSSSSVDLQRWRASKLHWWLRRPQKQLDALRQPGPLSGRTKPGGMPEQPGHLLLHHPTGGTQPGAAGVVQPGVRSEALQPTERHQTKWVQPRDVEKKLDRG